MVVTARCGASSSGGLFFALNFRSFVIFAHKFLFIYIGQTHCRLYSTSYSDRPTVPQHHKAAPGYPARWIGYDGDCSCFIRRPRCSSSQSRFIKQIRYYLFIIFFLAVRLFFTTFTTPFFYDVHKILFFLVELHLPDYGLLHADLYAKREVVGFILHVVFTLYLIHQFSL